MDYKFTFEDGSDALCHYGKKGMKWGVWNAETRARRTGARNLQKSLRKNDRTLRELTIQRSRMKSGAEYYKNKSAKAVVKGQSEKAAKYAKYEKAYTKKYNEVSQKHRSAGEQMIKQLKQVEKQGYEWKNRPTEFNEASIYSKQNRQLGKQLNERYGKTPRNTGSSVNASSGNRITVKDPSKMSDKKRARWQTQKKLNTYRPQVVTRTVYMV